MNSNTKAGEAPENAIEVSSAQAAKIALWVALALVLAIALSVALASPVMTALGMNSLSLG